VKAVVVALGKVGLPLAAAIAQAGHEVIGADIDARVVESVNAGRAPFPNEPGLEEALTATPVRATTDTTAAVAEGADLVVAVPPLLIAADGTPQWEAVDDVARAIGMGLTAGATVVLETTVPVGATRARFAPALERASGLRAGADFHVAFSPERISSGSALRDLATYPKIVGGLTPEAEHRAAQLYRAFLTAEVRELGGAEAAELTKLVETTYRDVNIALANEFARHADALGLDIAPVIDAANSQPYSHVHRPGIAVGGHCIPVYPRFYLQGDENARLPAIAREVNEAMPAYAVSRLADVLGDLRRARVLILGIAYRGGVKETAFSGARPLRDALEAAGATVMAADPLYGDDELRAHGFAPYDGEPIDGAVVQTDHASYRTLGPQELPGARAVIDGRGVLDRGAFAAAGLIVRGIGTP
jgi:UDP-N-acetyl-D-glucosamine dehydrogenase